MSARRAHCARRPCPPCPAASLNINQPSLLRCPTCGVDFISAWEQRRLPGFPGWLLGSCSGRALSGSSWGTQGSLQGAFWLSVPFPLKGASEEVKSLTSRVDFLPGPQNLCVAALDQRRALCCRLQELLGLVSCA